MTITAIVSQKIIGVPDDFFLGDLCAFIVDLSKIAQILNAALSRRRNEVVNDVSSNSIWLHMPPLP